MKFLLRLYPSSWRKRYGREMEVLLEELPGGLSSWFDLVWGAAIAYATVIRGNRILSAAGAYLHGVVVSVLLQAIVFVSFVLYASRLGATTDVNFGPMHFAVFYVPNLFLLTSETAFVVVQGIAAWLVDVGLLAFLLSALVAALAGPRLLKQRR